MIKKIVVVSDFNFRGSGYLNISVPLCDNLSKRGYDIKAVGLGNGGEEHGFAFSVIPCQSFGDSFAIVNNLFYQWQPDLMIVLLDIPHQLQFSALSKQLGMKMIAITPLENAPLTFSWSQALQEIDKVFFISQLGADEGHKAGLESSEHLQVGMDTSSWRLRTQDEYVKGREALNIPEDTLVVLTIADNQERKNLSKAFEIVGKTKASGIKVKYLLVTREQSEVGWKLRDLAMTFKIASELMIFERGISFKELYALYAISDAFLLTSKAEGLNMAVLESMSVGVPVVATACGSLPELLGEGRGFLMKTEYSMIDPWGNSRRDFPDAEHGVSLLKSISIDKSLDLPQSDKPSKNVVIRARQFMEDRTWDIATEQVILAMENLDGKE